MLNPLGVEVLAPRGIFRSATLNVRSATLNVRSTTLNVRSTTLNVYSATLNGIFLLDLKTFSPGLFVFFPKKVWRYHE